MTGISASVGQGGTNRRKDVLIVQNLLNQHIGSLPSIAALRVDGVVGQRTIDAIKAFQRTVVHLLSPDGRVDPNGRTMAALARSGQQYYHYPAGPQEPLADIARPYIGASEASGNRMGDDPRMREIFEADSLAPGGVTDGYPWCCAFVSLCVQKLILQSAFFRHVQPPRTASVSNFRTRWAPSQSCLVFRPADTAYQPHKGDVVVYTFSHIGIVDTVDAGQLWTIEGNTNEAGSREGTGVLRKTRSPGLVRCFIRLPIPSTYDIENLVCTAA
jgi:hypothetical protein